jgi:hypothetical protein
MNEEIESSDEILNPANASIPMTEEYVEARQAAMNLYRHQKMEKMLPEEQVKMKIIEQVSKQLEDAEIPFFLFASPIDDDGLKKSPQFWQFNKMDYGKEFKKSKALAILRNMFYLIPCATYTLFIGNTERLIAEDKNRKILYMFDRSLNKVILSPGIADDVKKMEKDAGLL